MQFKKTFSSNLQNLHVKKTMIMAPPPELSHHSSLIQDILSAGQSPLDQRHCRSTLQQLNSNDKENTPQNRDIQQCLSDSRHKSVQRNSNSPLLTFHNIRQQMSESQQPQNRKAFVSIPQNKPPLIHSRSNSDYKRTMKKSVHFSSNAKAQQNGVRLGSMVFANMPRKHSKDKGLLKESKSYGRLRSAREENTFIACMNGDGQPAKYKVADSDTENQDSLVYCFNCAIPLVKQGFSIEQLTFQDRQRLSSYSTHSTTSQAVTSRHSTKMKLGQQIKCKIIPKINKLKVAKDEFTRQVTTNTDNIDYYYDTIMKHIDQQREKDQQDYHRIVKNQKQRPEQYQQQLNSALGTIDYLLKHPQGLNQEAMTEVEEVVHQEQSKYPQKQSIQPSEGFDNKIQQFVSMFDQHFRLKIEPESESMLASRRKTFDYEPQADRNNQMRFSFQSALEESKRYQSQRGLSRNLGDMRPLQEQNQSQYDESMEQCGERQDAFRNLFPEQTEDLSKHKASPVFKQF